MMCYILQYIKNILQDMWYFNLCIYSLDFKLVINFSNFIAFCMFPLMFNLPVMNAETGFSLPVDKKQI